jgi:DNA topoisomerase III
MPIHLFRRQEADTVTVEAAPAPPKFVTGTLLRIPHGNKEVALKLGARYGSTGWYAPLGVDLSAFGKRGCYPRQSRTGLPPRTEMSVYALTTAH